VRRMAKVSIVLVLSLLAVSCGDSDDPPALSGEAQGAKTGSLSFTTPADGKTVARRFGIAMQASDLTIEPAGPVREGAGHFHVMIDAGCVAAGQLVPKDDKHVHFGKGQTEGQLFLEPGKHDLCLQVADGAHVALPLTDEISVTVDGDLPYVTLGVPAGDTVRSPIAVTMAASGVDIEPAGAVRKGAGHFHITVDGGCIEAGTTIPKDETHLHFGDGSQQTTLNLPPGEHVLCLQVGDGAHTALPITHRLTVVVA
jgi:hypothetical protein